MRQTVVKVVLIDTCEQFKEVFCLAVLEAGEVDVDHIEDQDAEYQYGRRKGYKVAARGPFPLAWSSEGKPPAVLASPAARFRAHSRRTQGAACRFVGDECDPVMRVTHYIC